MSRIKYFAIRYKNGSTKIKKGTWEQIKPLVNGKSGVVFKGFLDIWEAEKWIEKSAVPYARDDSFMERGVIYLFVDGSYSSLRRCSGWGWVCVKNNKVLSEGFGVITDTHIESRNIVGELKAAMEATHWAGQRYKEFMIVHDYMGISSWALGLWSAKKPVSMQYQNFMKNYVKDLKIGFIKVSGHKGVTWNEYADMLTRKGYDKNDR